MENEEFYKKVLIQRVDRKSIFNLNFKHDAFYEIIFYDLLSPAYILNNLFKELLGKACIIYRDMGKDKESKLLKTPSTRLLKKKRSNKLSPPPSRTITIYFEKKDRRYVKSCLEKLLNRLRDIGYVTKEITGI